MNRRRFFRSLAAVPAVPLLVAKARAMPQTIHFQPGTRLVGQTIDGCDCVFTGNAVVRDNLFTDCGASVTASVEFTGNLCAESKLRRNFRRASAFLMGRSC